VGSTVVYEANESIGTVNDLITTSTEKPPYAVLSVSGFPGTGTQLAAESRR
jgi:hypothetical protein